MCPVTEPTCWTPLLTATRSGEGKESQGPGRTKSSGTSTGDANLVPHGQMAQMLSWNHQNTSKAKVGKTPIWAPKAPSHCRKGTVASLLNTDFMFENMKEGRKHT